MLNRIKERFTISILNSLLSKYETEELNAGKRLISVVAGIYIFQKGIRNLHKHHIIAIEEIVLGGVLLFSAASGINKKIIKKPMNVSEVRKNQIQGNDPDSSVPAFV